MSMAETSRKKTSSMLWRTIGIVLDDKSTEGYNFFFLFSSVLDVGGVCFQHGCILGIRS